MLRHVLLLVPLCATSLGIANDAVLERYWELLVKSPKRGATFDRVYGHYVDLGQSATFYQDCQKETQKNPDDAGTWLLFGLVAERRNQTEQAVKAFQTAGELESKNHVPMLYLGELLLNQRRVHEAIAALETANERLNTGNRNDRRGVLQTLALAYTRFGNPQKSLETWNQLADIFPNDPDILVQVAESMEFDGRLDEALKQYRRLVTMSDDPAERINFSLAAIDIMLRQGNDEAALTDLDKLLGMLDSESYLADAVRDRIDRIFGKDRSPQRQTEFYQKRIEHEPNDTASLLRLVRTLQRADKNAEAEKLLHDAIKVFPSNVTLRLMLIDLRAERNDIAGAVEQFQAIDKIVPAQTDYLTRWGTLMLQNSAMTESERRTEAATIWTRIAEKSPNDPVTLVQLADLFFRNRFNSEAEKFYKDALALRPNDFSYKEHLAAFYHQQHRKDKVLESLPKNAEAGQLLLAYGYVDEACEILREAVKTSPYDWTLQYRYLESLLRQDTSENVQSIRELLINIEKQISSDEQLSLFLQQEVQLLRSLQKLPEAINIVHATVETAPAIRSYWHLAALLQAEGNFSHAVAAVEKALGNNSKSPLPLLRFAAELYEHGGNTNKAIALYQQLAEDDQARSGDHWKQIITLQIQRGELPLALESSQNLLGRGTENADRLRFVADLFLNAGRQTDAVKLLRQALTYEPGNVDVLRVLAQTLAEAEQHEEAIELLWRLFDRHEHLSAKLSVIEILANEHNKMGRSDELIERLQMLARNYDRRREAMQALVRVFMIQGEDEEAQAVLETMLDLPDPVTGKAVDSDALWTLRELVGIAEKRNDFATAVRYQEILCQKSSDTKEQNHLFYLYDKLGDTAKTKKMFFDQVLRQGNLQDRLDLIDAMIRRDQYEMVAQVIDFLEMHEPEHWQIMFRRILVEAYQNKPVGNLVKEFRAMRPHPNTLPEGEGTKSGVTDDAWEELSRINAVQHQFFPVLFHQGMRRTRQYQKQQFPTGITEMPTFQDARFLVLGWLLREAMNKDFNTQSDNPAVMRQFRNTIEELRDMLPIESDKYDVLMDRLRLESFLLNLLQFDNNYPIFPKGMLKLQIDTHTCGQTTWKIMRKATLDGIADWQPALFQILITECINELVAERFKSELDSDEKLAERLSQILDNLCVERKTPPIYIENRDKMLKEATYLVKRSETDYQASLRLDMLTLSQKTDRLLAIWKEYIDDGTPEMRTKFRNHFVTMYNPLLWILRSQNREEDIKTLELSFRQTAQSQPLWFAQNLADFMQPIDEDLILFLTLSDYDSLETKFNRTKNAVTDILSFCTDKETKRAVCESLFRHLAGLLQHPGRYDVFSPSEQNLFNSPTSQLWTYLLVPSTAQQGRFARQFFGVDSGYASHQQILNTDQMTRLVELDRSLKQIGDFAFQVLGDWKWEPADVSPALAAPAVQNVAISRYRAELQGDRPVDRAIVYALVQNPVAVSNFSPVDELFCRILLFRRGLDIKTQFTGTRTDDKITPIRENYTKQFAQFLENKKRSSVPTDRTWANHITATLGDLIQLDIQSAGGAIEPSSDAELLQLVRKLEATDAGQRTLAEQLALALLYVRLHRYEDVATMLDSMDLPLADLPTREWVIACLAVQYGRAPDSPLRERGSEAVNRLLNFRLAERDSMFLAPILQHFNREEEAQRILDHLAVTVSDQRLLSELFYRMNSLGESQKENAAKIAQRILLNPAFLQNSRRITSDVYLFHETFKVLQKQNRQESVMPTLETRLRNLRDRTDSRILTAQLYQMLDRKEEAKALALELAQNPTAEPERRQMIVSLLLHFGLQKELEAMNRLLLEQNNRP